MTLSPPDTRIQVLYELALSIGPASTVEETLERALSNYLQKLDCSGGAALERRDRAGDDVGYDLVTAIPRQSSLVDDAVDAARDRLPDSRAALSRQAPITKTVSPELHRYYLRLPEFGALVLVRKGTPLPDAVVRSLSQLNETLAEVCERIALQQEFETQYRELFEHAPVMFALTEPVDGEPTVVDCNRRFASTLGHDADELVGRPLAELYTDESAAALDREYDRALDGDLGVTEREFRTRVGRRVTTVLHAAPRRDRQGRVVGTNSLYVDVTETRRQNQQLSVLNRVLRHNLRNALTGLDAQVEAAADRADDEVSALLEEVSDRTDDLFETVELSHRVRNVLDDTEVERHRVDRVVERLAARAREEFPDATVSVSTVPATVTATQSLDAALWELVENACEHAGDAPDVTVRVRTDEVKTTVSVADDGDGIPPAEHRVLTDGEETQLDHGSGLGLWLVHWVVRASGGDVAFDATGGTTVTVRLYTPDG